MGILYPSQIAGRYALNIYHSFLQTVASKNITGKHPASPTIEEPQFQATPLDVTIYSYTDGLTDNYIRDMRVRAHQRALYAQKEKAQKQRIAAGIASLTNDDNLKNGIDIMKKDVTTDHEGKAIIVKQLRPDKLPSMVPTSTKSLVAQRKDVTANDDLKRLQSLKVQVNTQIDKMRRDFIDDGMGFKSLQKSGTDQNGEKDISMNLKDKVQPTSGVEIKNGEDVLKGPDYYSTKSNGRLTRQQYQEQYEQM